MFTAVQDRSRERPLACVNTYTRDAVDPIDTMTSSGQAASLSLSKGDKPERENDLAFLDNIDELNANWPDYQVRASLQTCVQQCWPVLEQHLLLTSTGWCPWRVPTHAARRF